MYILKKLKFEDVNYLSLSERRRSPIFCCHEESMSRYPLDSPLVILAVLPE
jgi:hypothetical protein